MTITVENPTAEELYEALQKVPQEELTRLGIMIMKRKTAIDESTEWSEEDLHDFSAAGATLYEEIEAEEMQHVEAR